MRKTIALLLMLLVLLMPFAMSGSGTGSNVKPPEHMRTLTKEQMLADYDFFWDTLDKYCSPLAAMDSEKIEKIRKDHRSELENKDRPQATFFYSQLSQAIKGLSYIGHLNMVGGYYLKELRSAVAMGAANIPDYGRLLSDEKVLASAEWIDEISGAESGAVKMLDDVITEHIDQRISYIKIPSFLSAAMETQGPRVSNWIEENIDDDALILDIRGNSGGNGLYWYKYILPYLLKEDVYLTSYFYIRSWPEEPDCSNVSERYDLDGRASAAEYELIKGLPGFKPSDRLEEAVLYKQTSAFLADKDQKIFTGDVYLLTDGMTGSAAEDMAVVFKKAGIGTVIGQPPEQPNGNTVGLSPVCFALPNSRIPFVFQLQYIINSDGSCAQIYGVQPDIFCDGDPLEVCLNMVHEE